MRKNKTYATEEFKVADKILSEYTESTNDILFIYLYILFYYENRTRGR